MKLRAHLYATDASALRLCHPDIEFVAVVVPENRSESQKVEALRRATSAPVYVQPRGDIVSDLPSATLAVSWLYSQIFPPRLLGQYPSGLLNMHGGRIPEYRGASVMQWAIINGETDLWVTWHSIVEAVDAGSIWSERSVRILPSDDAMSLRSKMIDLGISTFSSAAERLLAGATPIRVPDLSHGRVWPQRKPTDGVIGNGWPERRLRNLIRALPAPWPAATYRDAQSVVSIRRIAPIEGARTIPYMTAEGTLLHLEREDSESV